MSKAAKFRHTNANREESKERSQVRKYEMKKQVAVINHINYERHHGFESTKHQSK
jgi:hypothetical protein